MLKVNDVTFAYSLRGPKVLENFSMAVGHGGVYGLLGPNGAGKSTLLYLMMGALTPVKGSVTLDGVDTRRRQPSTLSAMMLVPEEVSFPGMRLKAFLNAYSSFYPRFDREVFADCMREFMMEDNVNLHALSMGQKKKIYISFALAARTPLLLMDEPTNGLDIQAKAAFRRLISRYAGEEQTVIISTHQVRDLEMLLDRIVIMNTRRILFDQNVNDIQDRLVFERNAAPDRVAGSYSAIPSPGGFDIMRPNTDGSVTEINLELLFDYAMREPQQLSAIFSQPLFNPQNQQ